MSKMTIKEIRSEDFEKNSSMVFVEFLEFLCRIAYLADFRTGGVDEKFHEDFKDLNMSTEHWLF